MKALSLPSLLIKGRFGSGEGIGFTLYYATSFIFTGLSVAVAIHAGLFNIGSEGQAYLGGLGCAWWRSRLIVSLPWYGHSGGRRRPGLFGAAWAFIPAFLQAKRGSHIVITTIMFNYIGAALMVYLLVHVLIVPGKMAPETRTFLEGGQLPKLGWLMNLFGATVGGAVQRLLPYCPGRCLFRVAADLAHEAWVRDAHARLQPDRGRYAGIPMPAPSSSPCCSPERWPA